MMEVRKPWILCTISLIILITLSPERCQAEYGIPVADAGSSRYAAQEPVVLNGTGSYDPDDSGPLSYTWQQIAGPSVIIIDGNTATPTIGGYFTVPGRGEIPRLGGFTQTEEIQECDFELVVSDGELTSLPDIVKIIIVADFGINKLIHGNPPFDPEKPIWVSFSGLGGCQNVGSDPSWFESGPTGGWQVLDEKANFITFKQFWFSPDTIKQIGDMLIVYLSSQAPDYNKAIQSVGGSAGGEPAIEMGIYLNETYADRRYAVNRVTFLDAAGYCRDYRESVERFLASSVDGEQCWIDNYPCTLPGSFNTKMDYGFLSNVLNVWFDAATGPSTLENKHQLAGNFYSNSFIDLNQQEFNHGVIAGAYWSVIGPGKNLQLASTPDVETYKFAWYGDEFSGHMDFYDEPNYPGRLPEPVTLVGPEDSAIVDTNGAVFSCEESENVVGYQLLFGPDPYRVMDYYIISDTPSPPTEIITSFPYERTWWTVRVYDTFGSTIYADPRCISFPAYAKYNGGTGEPNDPYKIATAEDLMLLGDSPEDYDKHFKLMADIDLSGYLYDTALIAPDVNTVDDYFQGTPFNSVFDGNGHTISHLTVIGGSHLGLFGLLESGAEVRTRGR